MSLFFGGKISYENGLPDGNAAREAIRIAESIHSQKILGNLSRLSYTETLDSGHQVYVLDLEHVWQLHIVTPYTQQAQLEDSYDLEDSLEIYPILGVVSGEMRTKKLIDPPKLSLTSRTAALFSIQEVFDKINISPHPAVQGMDMEANQFAQVVPTNYTGAMRLLVQLLLGVGNYTAGDDYADRWADANQTAFVFPEEYFTKADEVVPIELVGSEFFESFQLQIQYDWRFGRTHGIMVSTDQTPFLVELGTRGALVSPFFIDEASQYDELRLMYEAVYPFMFSEAPFQNGTKNVFDFFGGMPTGRALPSDNIELRRWIKAGLVVQDTDVLKAFYDTYGMVGSDFGWDFHPTDPRAVITGIGYSDQGNRVSAAYSLSIQIIRKVDFAYAELAGVVIGGLGLSDFVDVYKANHLSNDAAEQIAALLDVGDTNAARDAFDEAEGRAEFSISPNLFLLRKGYLEGPFSCPRLYPCNPLYHAPHFKYYESVLGEVTSFDFESLGNWVPEVRSLAPLIAYHVGSQLDFLMYSYDPFNRGTPVSGSTRQYCQFTGSWQDFSYTEGEVLQGYFFTSQADFRQMRPVGGGRIANWKATKIGHADFAQCCSFFGSVFTLSRHYFVTYASEGYGWSARQYNAAVVWGKQHRNVFFVCEYDVMYDKYDFSSRSTQKAGQSGTTVEATLYNFVFHWYSCGVEICNTTCHLTECKTNTGFDPCWGAAKPSALRYSVCNGAYKNEEIIIDSPTGGAIFSAYYTPVPRGAPGFSKQTSPSSSSTFRVYMFGHPLANGRLLREGADEDVSEWFRCSLPMCPVSPWPVAENTFGREHIVTYDNLLGSNAVDVEIIGGKVLSATTPNSVFFGVVL